MVVGFCRTLSFCTEGLLFIGGKKNSFNSIEEEEKFEWLENLRLSVFLRISLNNIIEKVKGKGKENRKGLGRR